MKNKYRTTMFVSVICLMWIFVKKNVSARYNTVFSACLEIFVPLLAALLMFLTPREPTRNIQPGNIFQEDLNTSFSSSNYMLGYAPANSATDEIMFRAAQLINSRFNVESEAIGFRTEYGMMTFIQRFPWRIHTVYAFDRMTSHSAQFPKSLYLIIRPLIKTEDTDILTEHVYDINTMQIVMESFISHWTDEKFNISIDWKPLYTRPVRHVAGIEDILTLLMICLGLLAYLIWGNTHAIAKERETGVTKLLRRTGVNMNVYWLSWFISTWLVSWPPCLLIGVVIFISCVHIVSEFYPSELFVVLIYFSLFPAAISSYCILCSLLCKKVTTSSIVACCLFFGTFFPLAMMHYDRVESILSFIIFNKNLELAIVKMATMETSGDDVDFNDEMGQLAISIISCSFVYALLARVLYALALDNDSYHSLKELFFWTKLAVEEKLKHEAYMMNDENLNHLTVGMQVQNLSAEVPSKLHNISFNIYLGQVTVIAALDTSNLESFVAVLTGESLPTGGTVTVDDLNLVKNKYKFRKATGLCPSDTSSFIDSFTVVQNLNFFYEVKRYSQEPGDSYTVSDVSEMCELQKLRGVRTKRLKESDRRLLQIAIAFLGNNKILLFDRPTMDMDVYTKSKTWNIIRQHAKHKIVLVCTDSIEEAEMVGDMVAVINEGKLKCYGSVGFLYWLYDVGYYLVIEKDSNFHLDHLVLLVADIVKSAKVVENSLDLVTFFLSMQDTASFYDLFTILDSHKDQLGIKCYSINASSLEESIIEKQSEECTPERKCCSQVRTESQTPSVKRFSQFVSTFERNYTSETTVDPSIHSKIFGPPDTEQEITEQKSIKKISKDMTYTKYTSWRLILSQAVALCKKRAILSASYFHVELVQVATLVVLAFIMFDQVKWGGLTEESMNLDLLNIYPSWVSHGGAKSNVSERLVHYYKRIFEATGNSHAYEVEEDKFHIEWPLTEYIHNKIGASFYTTDTGNVFKTTAWYSPPLTGVEDQLLPTSVIVIMNTFLHYLTDSEEHHMYVSRLPGGNSQAWYNKMKRAAYVAARRYAHNASFMQALALLMASYFVVLERRNGAKLIQHLSGVSPILYWSVNLLFDLLTYEFLMTVFPFVGLFLYPPEVHEDHVAIYAVGTANGLMLLPYVYTLQFLFDDPASAAFFISIFNYYLGDIITTLKYMSGSGKIELANGTEEALMNLVPPSIYPHFLLKVILQHRYYGLCKSNIHFCDKGLDHELEKLCCEVTCQGRSCNINVVALHVHTPVSVILALIFHTLFWSAVVLSIDYGIVENVRQYVVSRCMSLSRSRTEIDLSSQAKRVTITTDMLLGRRRNTRKVSSKLLAEDPGVLEELNKLRSTPNDSGLIRMLEVKRISGRSTDVSELNVQIDAGGTYCFVSSKISSVSTILKLLSGRRRPTEGTIYVKGNIFTVSGKPSFTPIGYSMEKNAAITAMTGRETLTMHAELRGIECKNVPSAVGSLISMFHLENVADKTVSNYSATEIRLLSIAVALIGSPEIILLHDPFSNLDLISKAAVAYALDMVKSSGSTIIMCSKTIREVLRKVTVLGILVDGELVCLGPPEVIRKRYCNSYTLLAKIDPLDRHVPIETLLMSLTVRFPKCVIFYDHQDFMHLRIPYEDSTLPEIFALMESAKKHLKIESYLLKHTNISNVITSIDQRMAEGYSQTETDNDQF